MESCSSYSVFPRVSSGVDWLTCTNSYKGVSNPLEEFGYRELARKIPAAGATTAGKCLGYYGRRAEGLFVGRNDQGVLLQLSGPLCTPLAVEAITLSTNVSRIDLQVTCFTEGEACHLAAWTMARLVERRGRGIGRGKLNLIRGHPDGETLTVNSRTGECFYRLYDKTAEAKLGVPLLLWRYEVEWKGRKARWVADTLRRDGCSPTNVNWLVHDAWTRTGVEPAFSCRPVETAFQPYIATPTRDVLTWMRASLSITVAKAINKYGRSAVFDALGLLDHQLGGPTNGNRTSDDPIVACHVGL